MKSVRISFLPLFLIGILAGSAAGLDGRDARPEKVSIPGSELLGSIAAKAEEGSWKELPFNDVVGKVALSLRGTPYVSGTLEGKNEVCRVNLAGLDCVTFFETSLGAARLIVLEEELTPENLIGEITTIRYRDGAVDGYTSRLHYFVDWIADNESKGIVEDITSTLPHAVRDRRPINFMSAHLDAYAQLKSDPKNQAEIRRIEGEINGRERYFVPKQYIGETEKNLQTGDIVGITTSIDGLDVSHTGFCYRDDSGRLRLLHASSTKKEVVLDTDLKDYLAGNAKQTGIIVARPIDPRAQSSSE